MKLIIDIPEDVYKNILQRSTEIQAEGYVLECAVLNGTPLDEYIIKAEKENFIQTCEVFRERIAEV